MIEMSQQVETKTSQVLDLKEYLKEVLKEVQPRHKLCLLLEDVVTSVYASELFAKPINELPQFYKGEYKPKPESYEHFTAETMRKKAKEFKLPKIHPPSGNLYKIKMLGNYNSSFEERVAKYDSTYGRELTSYLNNQGRKLSRLERVGTIQTRPGNPALVAKIGERAALLGSYHFDKEVENFARAYGVPNHVAERYIFDHEYTHLSQPYNHCIDSITAELDVERTLKNFYLAKARENPACSKEYLTLASIPMTREHQVTGLYSKAA